MEPVPCLLLGSAASRLARADRPLRPTPSSRSHSSHDVLTTVSTTAAMIIAGNDACTIELATVGTGHCRDLAVSQAGRSAYTGSAVRTPATHSMVLQSISLACSNSQVCAPVRAHQFQRPPRFGSASAPPMRSLLFLHLVPDSRVCMRCHP